MDHHTLQAWVAAVVWAEVQAWVVAAHLLEVKNGCALVTSSFDRQNTSGSFVVLLRCTGMGGGMMGGGAPIG